MSDQGAFLFGGPARDTLSEARRELMDRGRWEGVRCRCCDQWAKVYPLKLSFQHAYAMILMYRHQRATGEEWIHLHSLLVRHGSLNTVYSKAKYWGFIEPQEGRRDDGNPSTGFWRLTPAGVDFVLDRSTAPSHAIVYADEVLRFEEQRISVREALGRKFNYAELMAAVEAK